MEQSNVDAEANRCQNKQLRSGLARIAQIRDKNRLPLTRFEICRLLRA